MGEILVQNSRDDCLGTGILGQASAALSSSERRVPDDWKARTVNGVFEHGPTGKHENVSPMSLIQVHRKYLRELMNKAYVQTCI